LKEEVPNLAKSKLLLSQVESVIINNISCYLKGDVQNFILPKKYIDTILTDETPSLISERISRHQNSNNDKNPKPQEKLKVQQPLQDVQQPVQPEDFAEQQLTKKKRNLEIPSEDSSGLSDSDEISKHVPAQLDNNEAQKKTNQELRQQQKQEEEVQQSLQDLQQPVQQPTDKKGIKRKLDSMDTAPNKQYNFSEKSSSKTSDVKRNSKKIKNQKNGNSLLYH